MGMQWIDAVAFKDKGGFRVESQFVREVGQSYLLGCGVPGVPVASARTGFSADKPGMRRLWVRTRNWLREHGPGRFYVLVDGVRAGNEMGNLPSENWVWQIAGDVFMSAGDHELAVEDTTGYFPRFAAFLITDDMDLTPSPEWERARLLRAQLLSQDLGAADGGSWDVVVAGAGPGGIPAAVAAARAGMRVALLNSRPVLGGNGSNEATVGFNGAYTQHPGFREGGIAEEMRRIRDKNATGWQGAIEILVAGEPNLRIFHNTEVIDAEMKGGRIAAAVGQDTLTGSRTRFAGRMFVDATGDGWLGYYAGALYRVGREARWQYDEEKAPHFADNRTMSGCIMSGDKNRQMISYYAEDAKAPSPYCAPVWAQVLPEKLHRAPNRVHTGEWWIETPTDYDDLFEAERVRDYLMLISLGYYHWLKNHYEKRDLMTTMALTDFATYNAKRESRRLIGDYVLRQEDCTSGRDFPDAIAHAGWTLDIHNNEGIFSGLAGPYDFDIRVPINQIPYRCTYSKNVDNLYMSGRCLSVSHVALGTVRVQNTLAAVAQAVGTAAAMAIQKNTTPRGIYETHMKELQQALLRDDQYIPGVVNEDTADLARKARITATSVSASELFSFKRGIPEGWWPLDTDYCMHLRYPRPFERKFSLFVKNAGAARTLALEWIAWEGKLESHRVFDAVNLQLPGNYEGYAEVPRRVPVPETGHFGLRISATKGVSLQHVCMAANSALSIWVKPYWHTTGWSAFRHTVEGLEPAEKADCAPLNVVSGVSRPLGKDAYGWVSDPKKPLPQEIMLSFDEPVNVSMVQLTFDSDFVNPFGAHEMLPVVPRMVRDYDVALVSAGRETGVSVKDNNLRLRRHALAGQSVDAVVVRIHSTWGDPSARIFEIRVY